MAGETGGTTNRILNRLQYAMANVAADITTATTSDLFPIADVSDDYEIKWADGANVLEAAGVTATAAELNAAADVSARAISVSDAATYTVLAANSGKPHILPNFTASCTLTLPTAASGLEYTFIGKAVAADAQNWVFDTGSAAAFYLGGLQFLDTDEPASAVLTSVFPNGSSNDIMTIVTPGAATRIHLVCDGTNWIVNGIVASAAIPTFTDT